MTTEKKSKTSPESIVREIKRKTRRKFSAEEKIPYRSKWIERRREHYRPLPQRGNPSHQLLQVEQIIPRGRQEAA